MTIDELIADIDARIETCWQMMAFYLKNRDAHGCHDTGVEVQALERSRKDVLKLI